MGRKTSVYLADDILSELGALAPFENASTDLSQLSAELTQTIGSPKL